MTPQIFMRTPVIMTPQIFILSLAISPYRGLIHGKWFVTDLFVQILTMVQLKARYNAFQGTDQKHMIY